jgi:hypothetical protein
MPTAPPTDFAIPPALAIRIQAVADRQHRPAADIVRDALEHYLADSHEIAGPIESQAAPPGRTSTEAAARLLENRKGNALPRGLTIRDMQTHGRA